MASEQGSRNESFTTREPFSKDESLHFHSAIGSFHGMNPTHSRFEYTRGQSGALRSGGDQSQQQSQHTTQGRPSEREPLLGRKSHSSVSFLWRSRDNRKGRHALLVHSTQNDASRKDTTLVPRTKTIKATLQGVKAMATHFPYWDISWLIAVTYTIGSLIWIGNGTVLLLSMQNPDRALPFDVSQAIGWSAFVGASVFFLASILMMIEVLSSSSTGCFGWEIRDSSSDVEHKTEAQPSDCSHHHQGNHENVVGGGQEESSYGEHGRSAVSNKASAQRWLPSWNEIKCHYIYEISFISCSIQMFASILFWGSKFLAIPEINGVVSQNVLVGGYYIPTIIGGAGFIVSSVLTMLETQHRWYRPALGVLGWHEGFWKLLGSIGFTLSAAFGPFSYADQFMFRQSCIASFWGSAAILLGSLVQWFESLDKHPVVTEDSHEANGGQ